MRMLESIVHLNQLSTKNENFYGSRIESDQNYSCSDTDLNCLSTLYKIS